MRGVTGVLFFHKNKFVQIIEGTKENLIQLMNSISKDSRHENVNYLFNEPIEERGFESWNMDSFNLSNENKLNLAELNKIGDAYKAMFKIETDTLVELYKQFAQEGFFKNS